MTDEPFRTRRRVPLPTRAFSTGVDAGTEGFAPSQVLLKTPHPDFIAKAAIWRDQGAGLISLAEAQRRSAAIGLPPQGSRFGFPCVKGAPRPRHARPAPKDSRQYARPMATAAARDDRLTPNSKAFLQVLRARCGKGRTTSITKATAGRIMARSPRTIRRYLIDLTRFGYIEVDIRRNACGMHTGLVVTLTAKVMPFYEDAKSLADWLAETPASESRPFEAVLGPSKRGVTILSPINQILNISPSASLRKRLASRFARQEELSRGGMRET